MISEAEKNRFSEICRETVNKVHERSGIGTYKEKIVIAVDQHAAARSKRYE